MYSISSKNFTANRGLSTYYISIPKWFALKLIKKINFKEEYNGLHLNGSAIVDVEIEEYVDPDYRRMAIYIGYCDDEIQQVKNFINRIQNIFDDELKKIK